MSKEIYTLIRDVHELFNPELKHQINEDNLAVFVEHCVGSIRDALESPDKEQKLLRLSATGKGPRKLWFEKEAAKHESEGSASFGAEDGELQLRFLTGHIVEAMLLFLAREAGHTVEHEQEEVEIEGIPGHIDAVIDGHLVDVKTASQFSFGKFKDGSLLTGNDPYGYLPQISAYNRALKDKGVELKEPSYFWAYNKSNSNSAILAVEEYLDANGMIRKQQETLEAEDVPMERCFPDEEMGKNMRMSKECKWCPFQADCIQQFKDAGEEIRSFQYANEVVHLTQVNSKPKVQEIE